MLKATLSLRDIITHEVLSTEDVLATRDDNPPRARTVSGYGCKLPTPYRVNFANRWYRVYARCWSNCPTYYLHSEKLAEVNVNIIVTDIFEEVPEVNDQFNEDDVLFLHYVKHCDPIGEPTLADAKARFIGRFESEHEFGKHCWRERGWLDNLPYREASYIDFRSWVDHAVNSGLFVVGDTLLGVEADIWVWKPSL